ncbi:hypothetical protein FB45DRAFT_1029338 [Roridomyces roridus]|uniref:Uncharacterized protein n=1 Tax=Roridomyces roridus TaxID=1738132 RepID=A0AAD7FM86_9AGAR|nr:hypothetical protein FB45DRAFT_1029338 [Roridomyces roridus]
MTTVPALPPAIQTAIIRIAETSILSYLADIGLCGILSVQIYTYYLAFPNDRWTNKTFVYAIYLLNLLLTGIFIYNAFILFGSGFGDILGATKVHSDWYMGPILGGFGEHLLP